MDDDHWDKAWSSIQPNDRVRWVTPRFVKFGRVLSIAGRSASFVWDDGTKQTLPDARWYFAEGKRESLRDEHLVILVPSELPTPYTRLPDDHVMSDRAWISTEAAAEMLAWDMKKLRRYLRSGTIVARKQEDRWYINRERLQAQAAKQGWV